jgi:hypothetical protein
MPIESPPDEDVRVGDDQRKRSLSVRTEASSASPSSSLRVPQWLSHRRPNRPFGRPVGPPSFDRRQPFARPVLSVVVPRGVLRLRAGPPTDDHELFRADPLER